MSLVWWIIVCVVLWFSAYQEGIMWFEGWSDPSWNHVTKVPYYKYYQTTNQGVVVCIFFLFWWCFFCWFVVLLGTTYGLGNHKSLCNNIPFTFVRKFRVDDKGTMKYVVDYFKETYKLSIQYSKQMQHKLRMTHILYNGFVSISSRFII